ncbi:hypothetical protein INR49_010973 [Caranx melampygus]|nr:hypothetical protein INR49_010973 [Caranx melampygus]
MQAVLSLYATGRTTGVVLDSGDGVTHVVPIYEGFAIPHSIMRVDIAGRDVSRYLRLLLRKEGYNFNTSAEFEVVRTIKERACYLSLNPQKDETLETEKAQYVLPDGSTLNIGPARFRAPELLFRPDLIGDESSGIHEVLAYAIQKSDMDLRRTLFSTIVLCGGSTLIKGFGERLLTEVKKLAPKDVKIKISAPRRGSTPHGLAVQSWRHWTPLRRCGCRSGSTRRTEHVPSTGRRSRRSRALRTALSPPPSYCQRLPHSSL